MWVNGRYVSFILGSTSISALEHSRYCLNISSFLIVRNERSKESNTLLEIPNSVVPPS